MRMPATTSNVYRAVIPCFNIEQQTWWKIRAKKEVDNFEFDVDTAPIIEVKSKLERNAKPHGELSKIIYEFCVRFEITQYITFTYACIEYHGNSVVGSYGGTYIINKDGIAHIDQAAQKDPNILKYVPLDDQYKSLLDNQDFRSIQEAFNFGVRICSAYLNVTRERSYFSDCSGIICVSPLENGHWQAFPMFYNDDTQVSQFPDYCVGEGQTCEDATNALVLTMQVELRKELRKKHEK